MSFKILTGDEAVAWGAIHAGITISTAYPGTPASEIQETIASSGTGTKYVWAVNEKVAYENALGASYANQRALISMKHIGLNVAADPFINSTFTGVNGGLVLAVGDDPSMYSSQNEQDSRFYAQFAKTFSMEPSDPQEAYEMTMEAFEISERLRLPVLLRLVTRLCYGESPVHLKENGKGKNELKLEKDVRRWVVVPSHARMLHKSLNEKQKVLEEISENSPFNSMVLKSKKRGIIASGIAYAHAMEHWDGETSVLKIGTYPLPMKMIRKFMDYCGEILVVEEGEPIIEKALAELSPKVHGKLDGTFPRQWEMTPDLVAKALRLPYSPPTPVENLPPRYPTFCPGCGYNFTFKALKKINPQVITGDIGCYSLAVFPPFEAMDTTVCMGASIGMALGLAYVGVKKPVAVIGDSTFFHAGLPAMVDAVHNNADILVLIMDNELVAMTGGQPTPASADEGKTPVTLEQVLTGLGVTFDVLNPYRPEEELLAKFKEMLEKPGPVVLISRSPCITEAKRRAK
ncbi:MAG: thiamine pyrophosphate-dependent enzyme [Caldiserica bacterium]|jgi:indolepyruvate ferredoxin oxidoreductase alpha subunit|nr:thiamine pyrophosphate-dependent enzyme [Caldisericota bacterium]